MRRLIESGALPGPGGLIARELHDSVRRIAYELPAVGDTTWDPHQSLLDGR